MYKVAYNMIPPYLYVCELFQRSADSILNNSLRSVSIGKFDIPRSKLSIFKESLSYSGSVIRNSIPREIKKSSSLNCFADTCNVIHWMHQS